MFLLSLTAPQLNLSIMCVNSVEFHLESEIIFCQYSCIQTMLNLIPCCLAKESFNINKVLNTSAKLLFCSFDLLFCLIFISIALMVCSRSLILLLSSFFLYFKIVFNCNLQNPEDEMTEYQEKQWNIFICNVSFSLFNLTRVCSCSLPLILHSLHTVWSKSEHCSSYFFEIIRCPLVVVTSFWPLAVLILAITSQRSLENWMLQSPLSQQSRKLCLVKLNLNYHGLISVAFGASFLA